MKYFQYIAKYKWYIIPVVLVVGVSYYYLYGRNANTTPVTQSYAVVETVGRGDVSSGIQTTGKIIAEQKLDLNVYKQQSRIGVVNVANGSHVEAGNVLVSFDKSDAYVTTQTSRVSLTEAELALKAEQANATDPNTQIRTLENQIAGYKKSITDTQLQIVNAYQDFLNTDLEVVPGSGQATRLATRTTPVLSGRYVGTSEGEYVISIYSSGAESGYSFRLSGLETDVTSIYFGKAINLGVLGLKVTFPTNISNGDEWVIEVPNVTTATYGETFRTYNQDVADLKQNITGYEVSLKNAEQNLNDLKRTDSSAYRNLNVEKAALTVSSEQQKLAQSYDALKERDIVAPFPGTIQDMANVVVGATPTGGSSDSITLGTLISDTFLTTFTLSAADTAKVSVGQKVGVTVTSFADQPKFEGVIIGISSLPASTGVAQYEITAKLTYDRTKDTVVLREGMLADIEVVQQEKKEVLRIPVSAITYPNRKPTVNVIDSLTDAQKAEIARIGVVRTNGAVLPTHPVTIELGIQGTYYAEVVSGLTEGDYVLTTVTTPAATTAPVVNQAGFGGPGGGRTRTSTNGSPGETSNTTQNSQRID